MVGLRIQQTHLSWCHVRNERSRSLRWLAEFTRCRPTWNRFWTTLFNRRESLRLTRRFEPAHLSLALSGWLMGDFGPVVRVLTRVVNHRRHDRPVRCPIAPQLVGDQSPRFADGCWISGASSFSGVLAGAYWSSTTRSANPSNAWYVSLYNGTTVTDFYKGADIFPAWPVRGGQ